VGWWRLDEGAGTSAADSSGNGNNGDLVGDPAWVVGQIGKALHFNGTTDYVEVPHADSLTVDNEVTVMAWINAERHTYPGQNWQGIMAKGNPRSYSLYTEVGQGLHFSTGGVGTVSSMDVPLNEWVHVCAQVIGGSHQYYLNAEDAGTGGSGISLPGAADTATVLIGDARDGSREFAGMMDDVRIYNRGLTVEEVAEAMKGEVPTSASSPVPEDLAADIPRDGLLTWKASELAATHDVYFTTVFEDINTPAALVSKGQTETAYDPGRLDFGQTYFWRVDEVNGPPDFTVFAGNVWAFTVEPLAYPIAGVTATASSAHQATMDPANTVNGSGLNELDQHSTDATHMWLSGMGDAAPWIQYEFDKAYKLHEMLVWNSNQLIESFIGLGAKDVVVEHSLDGAEWTVLEGATLLNQATGAADYTANTSIDFAGVMAQFVRISVNAGWGMMPQYGLSEVRFLYIPTFAREPQPADASTVDTVDVVLQWRAGREAGSHQVYLGTDPQDLPLLTTTSESQVSAGELSYSTTYYWSVTEVNELEDPTSHASDTWSFTTPDYGIVDSFEQYNDNCNRIFFAWEDGLGHNGGEEIDGCDVAPSAGNGGGSIVGNDTAPFAEKTIVNAGSSQSMPLNYDNAFGDSYATLSLAGQNWTTSGIQTLALAFRGTAGNTGQLYVKVNNSKIAYDGGAADIASATWQAWNIDLTAVSGLQNVTSLTIGVDGASAAGMLYIDDIRLYPLAGELITPADPGSANLVGAWNFDAGSGSAVADSSGNGNNGVIEGNTNSWVPGKQGTALSMGNNVYVSVPAAAWASIDTQFTVAFWALGDDAIGNNWGFYAGDASGRLASCHLPWGSDVIFDTTAGWSSERIMKAATTDELRGQWRHWIFMKNAETGEKQAYLDGRLYDSVSASADPIAGVDRFFIGAGDAGDSQYLGLIDEFQLFNRALSAEEALWLAGGTAPIHKPL